MNSSSSGGGAGDAGIGGGMKAFMLMVVLFLLFMLFASSSMANVDLTDNTPGSAVQGAAIQSSAQVVTIQNTPAVNLPVTGALSAASAGANTSATLGCTNPYAVRPGDSLSKIAVTCNTSIASIRLANPQITNVNMIYPGQQLRMAGAQSLPVTGAVDQVGAGQLQAQPTAVPAQPSLVLENKDAFIVPQAQTASVGFPTVRTGTRMQVRALNYPPNTPVNIAVGPLSSNYNIAAVGITDAQGSLLTSILIPAAPDAATPWVVVVVTASNPVAQAMSQPFYVGPALP